MHDWSPESVPRVWNGKCNCPEPGCFPIITAQRAKSNEHIDMLVKLSGQSGNATVKAGRVYIVEAEFGSKQLDAQNDRTLTYQVSTSDDIQFSVRYIDALADHASKQIRDPQRIAGKDGQLRGEYTVSRGSVGCVQLVIDNTHS